MEPNDPSCRRLSNVGTLGHPIVGRRARGLLRPAARSSHHAGVDRPDGYLMGVAPVDRNGPVGEIEIVIETELEKEVMKEEERGNEKGTENETETDIETMSETETEIDIHTAMTNSRRTIEEQVIHRVLVRAEIDLGWSLGRRVQDRRLVSGIDIRILRGRRRRDVVVLARARCKTNESESEEFAHLIELALTRSSVEATM